jgi:membrane associated rhomboid family serine protease
MNFWEKLKIEFAKGNSAIRQLIIINAAFFIVAALIGFVAHLYNQTAQDVLVYLELPSWGSEFFKRPWTLVTYMFLHIGFFHFLFNMLLLYMIGRIAEDFISRERIFMLYLGGGIVGGLLYLVIYNVFPAFTSLPSWVPMLGASGAVIAVVVGTATLLPNYEVFLFGMFRLKLVWIALYLVAMDILFFPNGNEGGRLAHLGGALFGFLFIRYIQGRLGFTFPNKLKRLFEGKRKGIDERDIVRNRNHAQSKAKTSNPNQDEVDAILDKINQSGYGSLSQAEKEKLFRASE